MRFILLLVFVLGIHLGSKAQVNLIANPGFENIDSCYWLWYPNQLNSDWFNVQSSSVLTGICSCFNNHPNNPNVTFIPFLNMGGASNYFQYPNSGNCYKTSSQNFNNWELGGLTSPTRTYIETKLLQTLKPNKKYCGEVYINALNHTIDSSWGNTAQLALANYGFHLFPDSVTYFSSSIPFDTVIYVPQPDVYSDRKTINYDTVNYHHLYNIFTADGDEKFLVAGVLDPDSLVLWDYIYKDTINGNLMQNGNYAGYANLAYDDFGIYELPDIDAGVGDTICEGETALISGSTSGAWWPGLKPKWKPANGLSTDSLWFAYVRPTQTTTYYLSLSDTGSKVPCITDVIDSVTIVVIPRKASIFAGTDTLLCSGDTIFLQGNCVNCPLNYSIEWLPSTGLNIDNILQPELIVQQDQSYLLQAINIQQKDCWLKTSDEVKISLKENALCETDSVEPGLEIIIPSVLKSGELWHWTNYKGGASLELFDSMGRIVYLSNNYRNDFYGDDFPTAIYLFRVVLSDGRILNGKLCVVK
jgi:hypothetical protein